MESELRQKGVASLWHFTDINNLPLIHELGGLLSKQKLVESDVGDKVHCGGNNLSQQLDVHNDNWNKVSLSFVCNTPMFYRLKTERHFVFIEIDPSIVDGNTFFTDTNATANNHIRDRGTRGLDVVNFDAFDERAYSDFWHYYSQAEVLIENYVPQKYFKNIYFMSEASFDMGNFIAPEYSDKYISNFFPFEDFSNNNNNIPFIKEVAFTYQHIRQSNYSHNFIKIKSLIPSKEFYFRVVFFPDVSGNIIVKFKDKNGTSVFEIRETLPNYGETLPNYGEHYFWSEHGEFDTSILRNYNELYVDIYLNNVIYYQTYLSI